jgi:hypothetical protein
MKVTKGRVLMRDESYKGNVNRTSGCVDTQREMACEFNQYIDWATNMIGMPSPVWYPKNMVENPTAFYRSKQRRKRRVRG